MHERTKSGYGGIDGGGTRHTDPGALHPDSGRDLASDETNGAAQAGAHIKQRYNADMCLWWSDKSYGAGAVYSIDIGTIWW
jgi:hypothetical protein